LHLATEDRPFGHREARCTYAGVDEASREHAELVVGRHAARKEPGDHHGGCFDVGFDGASLFDHEHALEVENATHTPGNGELTFAANAPFDRDACFDSTAHR
jgi:hypothetical protein